MNQFIEEKYLNFNRGLYFLGFCSLAAGITYLTQVLLVTDQLYFAAFSEQLSADRIGQMLYSQKQWGWAVYVALPLLYLFKFTLTSACLSVGILFADQKLPFKRVFTWVMVAEVVFLIPSLIKIFWFLCVQTHYTLNDVQYFFPLSLLSIFEVAYVDKWLVYPLQLLNGFELLYWLVLAYGLHIMMKKDFSASLVLVSGSYGTGLLLWVVLVTFLSVSVGA
jgi:hypothetical protein